MEIRTEHPIAIGTVDHEFPNGTKNDNSRSAEFVRRMRYLKPDIRVLDLGCSGGGMVKDFVDEYCLAVGIEGSDYSRIHGRAEWPKLDGKNLFTADATKPFLIMEGDELVRFDLVTMWEFLEHIAEPDLDQLFRNIWLHLDPDGLELIAVSIATIHDVGAHGHDYHQTVQSADWWIRRFDQAGFDFAMALTEDISPHWVRGPLTGETDSFCAMFKRRAQP